MKVSVEEYILFLMVWLKNQLNNKNFFPLVVPFPKNLFQIMKVILKDYLNLCLYLLSSFLI